MPSNGYPTVAFVSFALASISTSREARNMPDVPSFSLLATGSDDGVSVRATFTTGC